MAKRILVWKGKHADAYYDASTDKALADASLDILRMWLYDNQYIYQPDDPFSDKYLDASWSRVSREDVEWAAKELVEDTEISHEYNEKVKKAKTKVDGARASYESQMKDYAEVKRLVDEWDDEIVTPEPVQGKTRMLHPQPYVKAWRMLQAYAGGEYQEISLEELIEFEDEVK